LFLDHSRNWTNHGHLVTIGEFEALDALPPDLVRQRIALNNPKAKLREEIRLVGEGEHSAQA
jgi:hypothetical protein